MSDVKRNEHTLPIANWLREQINETLSKYDVPSDVYDTDISIDALCVCAVDKAQGSLRARLEAVEKERDDYRRLMGLERQIADKNAQRAERVEAALALRNGECEAKKIIIAQLEAALATARRVADDAIKMCEDGHPVSAYNVARQVIRAIDKDATP